jgi:hypothetical protein
MGPELFVGNTPKQIQMNNAHVERLALIEHLNLDNYLSGLFRYGRALACSRIIHHIVERIQIKFLTLTLVDRVRWAIDYSLESYKGKFR